MANQPVPSARRGGELTRRRAQHPLDLFRSRMDDLFERYFGGSLIPFDEDLDQMRVWDFNVQEDDKEIVVRAEIPGFDEKDLDVQLSNDMLTIKAEKEQKDEGREEYRSFYRTVALPQDINPDQVQASYRNGVLEMHIPRAEGRQARRIEVKGQPAGTSPPTEQQTPTAQASTNPDHGTPTGEQDAQKTKS